MGQRQKPNHHIVIVDICGITERFHGGHQIRMEQDHALRYPRGATRVHYDRDVVRPGQRVFYKRKNKSVNRFGCYTSTFNFQHTRRTFLSVS